MVSIKYQILIIFCICYSLTGSAQIQHRFKFGSNRNTLGYTMVRSTDLYEESKGYGFESVDRLMEGNDFITASKPFYFSVKLPEGNYKIKMKLGDNKGVSTTTVRVECRRLMAEQISTDFGQTKDIEFVVHVRDSINHITNLPVKLKPREKPYFHWDDKLTFELNDVAPKLVSIEISQDQKTPTLFLAGNSTVVDQAEEPWASWGQMIPHFFKPGTVAIANYAESGETLKAFEAEGRLDKLFSLSKPGDYLFMEFAHNDQKPGINHLDPFTTYKEILLKWINKSKEKGMYPVLVTSTNRRTFDSTGHIYNSLGDYPAAMRELAKDVKIPLIDLNEMSKQFYEALGPVASTKAFVYFKAYAYPNQLKDVKDDTHFNTYGAYQLAKSVAIGIRENIPLLAPLLVNSISNYHPTKPDNPDQWHLPEGLFYGLLKPDGN